MGRARVEVRGEKVALRVEVVLVVDYGGENDRRLSVESHSSEVLSLIYTNLKRDNS